MTPIESFLQNEIGLNPVSIGSKAIDQAVSVRMKTVGAADVGEYIGILAASQAERDELVEEVVVGETWFFRDPESFITFATLSLDWLQKNPAGILRILSVPCCSGEEPYSLAMCLLDAGVPARRFVIDAADISNRSLKRAAKGTYGNNSFRGTNLEFRDRHFHRTHGSFELHTSVRQCVQFQQDNLLNDTFLAGSEPYHFIFCRNVLIYFDALTQARAVGILRKRLDAMGTIFVGASEVTVLLNQGFIPLDVPLAFACRAPCELAASRQARTAGASASSFAVASSCGSLDEARILADAGRLQEAEEVCRQHIRQAGPSAKAYCLMGLIHDAMGNPEAKDCYRKALYLEPDHRETLWHLALLMEKNGHDTDAHALKRRAERAQPNNVAYPT